MCLLDVYWWAAARGGFEFFFGHASLGGAQVLHVQTQNTGELGEVVHIATSGDQAQHMACANGVGLLCVQAVLQHVRLFIRFEGVAVVSAVERVAHLVEGIAFLGLVTVKQSGSKNGFGFVAHACLRA